MAESSLTIGGILALLFGSIIIMAMLEPIMVYAGVYNAALNSTSPAGNYIRQIYGANGLYNYTNKSVTNVAVIPFATAAGNSISAISPSSLSITSGFAFVAGGLGSFWGGLTQFPTLLYIMFTQSLSYQGFQKLLPYDLAAVLSVGLLGYVSAILALKLLSIISKPGASIENI